MVHIIFFEKIDSSYDTIIQEYLKKKFKIYFFDVNKKYSKTKKFETYLDDMKIIDASKIIFEYSLYRIAAFHAHENVDYIFDKYYAKNKSIQNMNELLDFSALGDMYKKELLTILEKIHLIQLKINYIIENNDCGDIYYAPSDYFIINSDEKSVLHKNVKVINCNNNVRIYSKHLSNKLFNMVLLFYPLYLVFRKIKWISNKKEFKKFKVGITIDHPKKLFFMNYCNEDYFIDDDELPKENVLFIDESGNVNVDDYKRYGYNYTRLLRDRETISTNLFFNKIIKCFMPIFFESIINSYREEIWTIVINRKILSDYIKWNIFVDNYKIYNHIKKLLPDNISKVHILSQNNVKTWLVFPDNSSNDYHLDWDETKENQTLFSFMHYDNLVVHGKIIERFFKKHKNKIKNYIKTGVLYSQIIIELQNGKLQSPLSDLIKEKHFPDKKIAIFDTTFADHGPVKIKDGIKFAEDILNLINDFPEFGFIFKAKKPIELTPYSISIYEKIRDHDRCLFFSRFDEFGISAAEVIAESDFVISAAYTSTAAEALGAKIKSIYYDVAGHELGDKYYFNRYPNFVAHNYEELKQLVKYWLYEITDAEFEDFLNTYVKDEIDPYLDGKAISRFRQLLME